MNFFLHPSSLKSRVWRLMSSLQLVSFWSLTNSLSPDRLAYLIISEKRRSLLRFQTDDTTKRFEMSLSITGKKYEFSA